MTKFTQLKIATWNCRGFKSGADFLKTFISEQNLDIILLQETWLHSFEDNLVSNLLNTHAGISRSAMDCKQRMRGRPFGGTAILWKKTLSPFINLVPGDDPRILCINLNLNEDTTTIANVYLPTADCPFEQSEYFGKLASLYSATNAPNVIIAGDFNCDPSKHRSYNEFSNLCDTLGLKIIDTSTLCQDTYTYYNESLNAFSWLDHVVASENLVSRLNSVTVSSSTPSDHLILQFNMELANSVLKSVTIDLGKNICWRNAKEATLKKYYQETEISLSKLLYETNDDSKRDASKLYQNIVQSLSDAEKRSSIKMRRSKRDTPGWNLSCEQRLKAINLQ